MIAQLTYVSISLSDALVQKEHIRTSCTQKLLMVEEILCDAR